MALRHFFRTIQKAWRFILIITLLAWSIALIISNSTTPLYRATATFVISPNADLTSNRDMFTSLDTLDKRTISSTYADILQSNRVYVETARNLNMDALAISRFAPKATVQPDSNILVLSVEGPVNSRPKFTTHSRVMFTSMIGMMFTTRRHKIKTWL